MTAENWKQQVWLKLQGLDWKAVMGDVRPFVEPGFDVSLLSQENFERLLFT
jgi:hypothetical protein